MSEHEIRLDGLGTAIRDTVRDYALLLIEAAGRKLLGLTIIGSAASSDYDPSREPIRNVAVLNEFDLAVLNRLRRHGVKLGKKHIQAPLIMTPAYIASSCDTFPIELMEIQQRHVGVLGTDPFVDLKFDRAHVRLQCEGELKRELIQLRQGLLSAGDRDKVLGALCAGAAEQTARILRAVLWLQDITCPPTTLDVFTAASKPLGVDLSGVAAVVSGNGPVDFAAFERLYRNVEALAAYVDKLGA